MQEYATEILSGETNHESQQDSPSRSYTAMILSAIFPGLGQFYLNQFLKGFIVIIVFVFALGLFILNSYPVREWRDLARFHPSTRNDTSTDNSDNGIEDADNSIEIWTLDNGKTIMFKPNWILKITATLQAVICWIYAVREGWRGRYK